MLRFVTLLLTAPALLLISLVHLNVFKVSLWLDIVIVLLIDFPILFAAVLIVCLTTSRNVGKIQFREGRN